MTKTQKRVRWINNNRKEIEQVRTEIVIPPHHKGHNAKGIKGMSGGGWGWWSNALQIAGIQCNTLSYWSGSNPTPSTAINKGIADYIINNAPKDIR